MTKGLGSQYIVQAKLNKSQREQTDTAVTPDVFLCFCQSLQSTNINLNKHDPVRWPASWEEGKNGMTGLAATVENTL